MAFEPGSPLTLQVGNDPDELAALLPPRAGQRFEILTSRREDAHRLIPEGETVRQANAERFKAERHLHLLQAPASERGNSLPSDDIHCVVARRQLEKLTNAARVLQERYATRGEGFLAIARVHTDAMAWISHGQPAGTIIEDAAEVKLNGKMQLLDQLAKSGGAAENWLPTSIAFAQVAIRATTANAEWSKSCMVLRSAGGPQ